MMKMVKLANDHSASVDKLKIQNTGSNLVREVGSEYMLIGLQ